jgi:hypothetical protein
MAEAPSIAFPYQPIELRKLLDSCVAQLQQEFGSLLAALPNENDQTR